MDETYIEAVRGPLRHFETAHMTEYDGWSGPGTEDHYTAFFYFGSPDTSVAVSDLTLEVIEPDVAEPSYTYYPPTEEEPEFYDYWHGPEMHSGIEISVATDCDTSFENIKMTGIPDLSWEGSPRFGISYWWSSGGHHVAKGCVFEHIGYWSYGIYGVNDAKFDIKSNTFLDGFRGIQTVWGTGLKITAQYNSFSDMEQPAFMNFNLDSSHMLIQRNTMVNGEGAIWVYNWVTLSKGSSYEINHIDIRSGSWYGGIEVWDGSDVKSDFVVVQNTIHADDFIAPYGPICMNGVHDAVIAKNKITGSGPAAMFIGTWAPDIDDVGLKIINNDVQEFELTDGWWDDYDLLVLVPIEPIAHIFLGEYSSECIVVLGSSADTIFDEGTDNLVVQRQSRFW